MDMNRYQELAARTLPEDQRSPIVMALGICGEGGEVADLIKKHIGQGHSFDEKKLKEEVADCLWYIAGMATCMGWSLEDVARGNIEKLRKRYPNGFDPELSRNRDC